LGYLRAGADLCAAGRKAPHRRQRLYWVAESRQHRTWRCILGPGQSSGQDSWRASNESGGRSDNVGLAHTTSPRLAPEGERPELRGQRSGQCVSGEGCDNGWMGHADERGGRSLIRQSGEGNGHEIQIGGSGPWSDSIWHQCRDGKTRRIPTEPAFFPLAHGIPGRVAMLKGFGNAIVPEVAVLFVKAYLATY